MKVLFISPSFYPATHYGGPTIINRSLCEALATNSEVDLEVLTTDADGPHRRVRPHALNGRSEVNLRICYCRRTIAPDISFSLLVRLPAAIIRADVVHLNGVYSFTTLPTLALCRLMRKPIVWAPFGSLQKWAGSTRHNTKRAFDQLCNFLCDTNRVLLHASSTAEQTESLSRIKNVASFILPYGTEISELIRDKPNTSDPLRLLYLGRLHPIKGIENLLLAMTHAHKETFLDVCGEGDAAYEASLRLHVNELGLNRHVRFHGSVAGEIKDQCFQRADICVVPSFKESFGAVVVESLSHAVPVIAAHGTPWNKIEDIGCGLWVSNKPEELAMAIDQMAFMPLTEMGMRGREWIKRDFMWADIAAKMVREYQSLIQSQRPKRSKVAADPKAA